MLQHLTRSTQWIACVGLAVLVPLVGCAPQTPSDPSGGDGGSTTPPGTPDAGPVDFSDFPADPQLDPGIPPSVPGLFLPPASTSGGPCLLEPETGTLLPRAWTRPRVSFVPEGSQNLFEIRLHAEHQLNDLRVYTRETSWTMPIGIWEALNRHFTRHKITVTVSGVTFTNGAATGPPASSLGSFEIAPVEASGSIVYWTTNASDADASAFKGFRVGEEVVHQILTAPQADHSTCVGCHSSTPDGEFVAFSATPPTGGDGGNTHIDLRSVDAQATKPSYITAAAAQLLGRTDQQQPVFSSAHWREGERIALSMWNDGNGTGIIWTDLAATSTARGVGWDFLARNGDSRLAAAVAWSRSGTLVAYTSSDSVGSGVNIDGGDIYVVPYGDRHGGLAMPVPGASSPGITEHYAAFSADDRLLAFTRVADSTSAYDAPGAETFVIPVGGGTAVRLAANDPPACTGRTSPGVTNSWPKWSPEVQANGSTSYYWLTFSSKRGADGNPQLYIAPVTINEVGNIVTYPAVYLWNQPADEANHTPAWDNFGIIIE